MIVTVTGLWTRCHAQAIPKGNASFKGRINDVNAIYLDISFYGDSLCAGVFTLGESGVKIAIWGKIWSNGTVQLEETATKGKVTGVVHGKARKKSNGLWAIEGEWFNHAGTISSKLWVEQYTDGNKSISPCGQNKWLLHSQGVLKGQLTDVIVQKNNYGQLTGVLYRSDVAASEYLFGGDIYADSIFEIFSENSHFTQTGSLTCRYGNGNMFSCDYADTTGQQETFTLYHREKFDVGCIDRMDFSTTYSFTYPKRQDDEQFNMLIGTMMEQKIAQLMEYSKSQKLDRIAENRSVLRASNTWQIEFMNEKMLSGWLTFSATWRNEYQTTSFVYDLQNRKLLNLDDIFYTKGTGYQSFVSSKIKEKLKSHPAWNEEGFQAWVGMEKFSYFAIKNEGIQYMSEFSPIYGRIAVILPFDALRVYLKPNTLAAELAKL